MYLLVYATTRLILFGFGWCIAMVLALLAEMIMPQLAWLVFALVAGWWTYACAVYVQSEAQEEAARAKL